MSSHPSAPVAERRPALFPALRRPRWSRAGATAFARRLAYFLVVWSALLAIHEAGHAIAARHQGLTAYQVTVGVGPVLWRGRSGATDAVLRLVPIAGMTNVADPRDASADPGELGDTGTWDAWDQEAITLAGGVLMTLALSLAVAGVVAAGERGTGRRWVWGRMIIADAVILTIFNFLPVPPLDGGRAVAGAITAWRGAPIPPHVHHWVQLGGLALAIVPMTLWTRWTAWIDRAAMRWGAPKPVR